MSAADALVAALVRSWRSGVPLAAEEASRLAPADEAEAYRVQASVAAEQNWFPGGRPRAWKLAAPKDRVPLAAPVPDAFLLPSPARLPPGKLHTLIGIEVELAVRLARDLSADADRKTAAAAVGATFAAIEIFDVRACEWRALPPTFLLADQQMHAGLILGTGVEGPWQDAYADCELVFQANGEVVSRRRGGHPLGDPLQPLPWLAAHAARYGAGLRQGDVVSTGSWIGLYEASAGDRLHASFGGLGEVELRIG